MGRWLSVDPLANHPNQVDKSPYASFWNNSIRYNDPDGRFPTLPTAVIGAAVGAVVGGGASILSDLWNGEEVSLKRAGKSAIAGGAAGFITGSGAGVVAAMGGLVEAGVGGMYVTIGTGVASGITGETTYQTLDMIDGVRDVGDFDAEAIAISGAIGAPLNIAGAAVGTLVRPTISGKVKKSIQAPRNEILKNQRAMADKAKNSGGTKSETQMARKQGKAQIVEKYTKKANTITQTAVTTVGNVSKTGVKKTIKKSDE